MIKEKIQNLEIYHTLDYKKLLENRNAIGCKWVFKVKYNINKNNEEFKIYLVAQGFSQVYGIDYTETFVPIIY